jgi:hypothetical protein
MKSYDSDYLSQNDPTSLDWGINVYRFFAKDIPQGGVYPEHSLEDEEISGLLEITSKTVNGVKYYLPFEALATNILTNPSYAISVSEDGYSSSFSSAADLARQIRTEAVRIFSQYYPAELRLGVPRFIGNPRF